MSADTSYRCRHNYRTGASSCQDGEPCALCPVATRNLVHTLCTVLGCDANTIAAELQLAEETTLLAERHLCRKHEDQWRKYSNRPVENAEERAIQLGRFLEQLAQEHFAAVKPHR